MRLLFLFMPVLFLGACSTSVKGPVTQRAYDINVGCTKDMKRYTEEREKLVGGRKLETTEPVEFECPPEEKK